MVRLTSPDPLSVPLKKAIGIAGLPGRGSPSMYARARNWRPGCLSNQARSASLAPADGPAEALRSHGSGLMVILHTFLARSGSYPAAGFLFSAGWKGVEPCDRIFSRDQRACAELTH